jgi:putative tryptophan/tyrosine transport system substrate-binding protein
MAIHLRRREFVSAIGGAAAWPLRVRAQQPAIPVIGFLRPGTAAVAEHVLAALRRGLNEFGYIEGHNVAVEYRWAESHERLPALAADLVRRQVAVIVAGGSAAAIAAKDATSAIPIVFVMAADPVEANLVASLNRPGGNLTGAIYLSSALAAKRVELMHELVPAAKSVAALVNPDNGSTEPFIRDLRAGAGGLGLQVVIANLKAERDLDAAFATLVQQQPAALIVGEDPLLFSLAPQIVALAARHGLPAIYTTREFAEAGGLMSWGTKLTELYRLGGTYVGRILKGAKPADLPVVQPTQYELVLNLKIAKALGLTVPDKLLALADEVIE